MDDKMIKFLKDLSQNEELQKEFLEKIGNQANEAVEALRKLSVSVAEFANDKGHDMNSEALMMNVLRADDEDLEKIAGGRIFFDDNGIPRSDCMCAVGGGGTADEYQKTCACVAIGDGKMTPEGDAYVNSRTKGQCHVYPLACFVAGADDLIKTPH